MKCPYCKGTCYKNGSYLTRNTQVKHTRFKCKKCSKTFTEKTESRLKSIESKNLALQLILSGCKAKEISLSLNIPVSHIKQWKDQHLIECEEFIPQKPLLVIKTMVEIFKAVQKGKIASLHYRKFKGRR